MKEKVLRLKTAFQAVMLILMLGSVGIMNVYAYDFSAVCSTGQTLYYTRNGSNVTVTAPSSSSWWDGYTKPTGELVIPGSVTYNNVEYIVTAIARNTFRGCNGLTSVTIGNTVTSIGEYAFYYCNGLTSISLGNSVVSIEDYTFESCSGLISIEIPNSVISIGYRAFYDCINMTSVTLSNSLTSIGIYAFRNCSSLTSIEIPNTVTTIGNSAFYNCTGLMSIIIGNSISYIDNYTFEGCSSLTSIEIPNSVTSVGNSSFKGCNSMISATIGNSVTSIGSSAFEYCSSLAYVTIGSAVTTIGYNAFNGCHALTSIDIPNSVTGIGSYAFSGCSGLTSIEIPSSVTSIGSYAFSGCVGLTQIIVNDNNMVYDSRDNCNAIIKTSTNKLIVGCKNTTIPNTVTSIGDYAFSGCSGLISIDIPNSVTTIGESSFANCNGLISIVIPNSVTTITNSVFANCSSLSSIEIPISVTTIGPSAFLRCSSLTSIVIPNSVTSIGNGAFNICSSLISIEIPQSVVSIGNYVFSGCDGLIQIIVDDNNTVYDSRDNCNAIIKTSTNTLVAGCKNTIIPNTVTSIGQSAFSDCNGLTSIDIPNSITSMESSAFQNCSNLTSVIIRSVNPPSIGYYVFDNTTCPIFVPYESVDTYKTTTKWKSYSSRIQPWILKSILGYGSSTESDKWAFIASPLADDIEPDDIDGLIATTPADFDLYQLNPAATNEWENWKQTGDHYHFDLVNGRGYLYANKNDVNIILKGDMFTGNYKDVTLQTGWNLVGNPYAQSAYINRSYYKMNAAGDDVEAVSAYTTTAIPVCTGVVVQGVSNEDVLRFTKTAPSKSTGHGSLQMTLAKVGNRGNEMQDKAIVIFEEYVQLSKYIFNENHAKLYILQDGKDYAIAYSDGQSEIPLYFRTKEMGTYTINFNNDAELRNIYLVDKFEGAVIDLSVCSNYTFIGSSEDRPDRFELVIGSLTESETDNFAYQSGNEIIVNGDGELQIFDVMGRMVAKQNINGVETIAKPSLDGVYIFRLNEKTQKIVVK